MTEIVEPPIIPTPEALVELAIERMQAQYPHWNPNPASPEYRKFLSFAAICTEILILAFNVPEAIIQFVGAVVYQTPINPATYARATATVTANDTAGHTIQQGTIFTITPEGSVGVAFEAVNEVVIPPGEEATSVGAVELQALEAGAESNVAGAHSAESLENFAWIKGVVTGEATGGEEEETMPEYTRRILELAKLITPRPILPEDFANFVRLLTKKEKVLRAVAVDGLELETEGGHTKVNGSGEGTQLGTGKERCVAVFAMNKNGEHLSTAAREEAEKLVFEARETSFKFFLAGPTSNTINVVIEGKTWKGWAPSVVESALLVALQEFINPIKWGGPTRGDESNGTGWVNRKTLRYQDLVTLVNNVEGFNFYTKLEANAGTVDIALTGLAPVVKLGTHTITLVEGTE